MKHSLKWLMTLWCLTSILVGPTWAAPQKKPLQGSQVDASPSAMESRYVTFKPNFPLMPGSLDLYGYEREKLARSFPILSPDKCEMAMTEVYYIPDNHQTYSRVFTFPVGRRPRLEELLPPDKLAEVEEQRRLYQASDPAYVPPVDVNDIDPHAFWDRYSPDKQMSHRQTLFEAGFATVEPYRVDIIQLLDWSANGNRLLMIYRPGIHHLGIYKTIPVIYDFTTQETVKLTTLPGVVWQDFLNRSPELRIPADRVWDIRPLGWSSQNTDDFIVKLVMFEGQSELSAGFWSYGTQSGRLQYLGENLTPDKIARNGWLVTFNDPTAPGGPQNYGPGQTPPPPKEPEPPTKRTWRDRVQFWKKQR